MTGVEDIGEGIPQFLLHYNNLFVKTFGQITVIKALQGKAAKGRLLREAEEEVMVASSYCF